MDAIASLAALLATARRVVAFTGAGISTESGLADFRSPGGVWARHRPVLYQDFVSSAEARRQAWIQKGELWPSLAASHPNAGHRALVDLEGAERLLGLITQNIDGLHQVAGHAPDKVVELHGTNREVVCLRCERRIPAAPVFEALLAAPRIVPPSCEACGGILKPATVSFGQALPETALLQAHRWAQATDLFLAIGSSLVVYPAAALPGVALAGGAPLVIINREETPYDGQADLVIRDTIGEVLPAAVARALGAA